MMATTDDPQHRGREIAEHILSKSDARRTRSYLQRGRSLCDHSDRQIFQLYKEGLRRLVANLRDCQLTDDAGAELQLRSVDLILDKEGKDLLEEFSRKAEELYASLPEERKLEIGEEMVAEYVEAMAQRC